MLLCDRCVLGEAKYALKLMGVGDLKYAAWSLCGDCLNHVCGETRKIVESFCPPGLREFCPSLTPDQAKKVEQYVAAKTAKADAI